MSARKADADLYTQALREYERLLTLNERTLRLVVELRVDVAISKGGAK